MAKDAYYFSHDSNAKDDPKCMLVIDQLGLEGYGIYWVLIEVLRDQPNFSYPMKLVPILARRYNTTAEKMMTVIQKYGLFELNPEEEFFSLSLNKRMEKLEASREQRRLAGKSSAEKRKLLQASSTDEQRPLNECSTSKVKESKVKESKEENNTEKLVKSNFALFDEVCSYFDSKAYSGTNLKKWLECYDKLIRIDGYTEEKILAIVKEFRKPDNWWRKNGNFESLLKLRKTSKDGVTFAHRFSQALPTTNPDNLGEGEYIDNNGNRTYGDGRVVVPKDAPKRPTRQYGWNAEINKWTI